MFFFPVKLTTELNCSLLTVNTLFCSSALSEVFRFGLMKSTQMRHLLLRGRTKKKKEKSENEKQIMSLVALGAEIMAVYCEQRIVKR